MVRTKVHPDMRTPASIDSGYLKERWTFLFKRMSEAQFDVVPQLSEWNNHYLNVFFIHSGQG